MKKSLICGSVAILAIGALMVASTSSVLAALQPSLMPEVPTSVPQAEGSMSVAARQALVGQYCETCHDDDVMDGNFSFSAIDLAHPDQNAEQTEKIILKLRTGLMPPSGMPRPDRSALADFASTLENELDRVASANPNPGRPSLYRQNRNEYRNSVRELLAVDIDVESLLPADSITQGFDNISEALTVTPTLMEAYIRAAGKISRMAVGDPEMAPKQATYRISKNFSQNRYVEGTPMGTRGGIAFVHNFPADAEYVFRMALVFTRNTFLFGSTMPGEQLEVAVNGERVALFDIDPLMTTAENDIRTEPFKIAAGPQTVTASFVQRSLGPIDDFIRRPERTLGDGFSGQIPGLTNLPHLLNIGVVGPYNVTGVTETPSRRMVFVCHPSSASEEEPCARRIVTGLARKAFRKPPTEEHLEGLMSAYQEGRDHGDFEDGIRMSVQFVMAHPEFVFRFERVPTDVSPNEDYRVGDLELASRLAYFLWSVGPDEELISVASEGRLKEPDVLRGQVRRMLADRRSEAIAKNFAGQWLHLRGLTDAVPDFYIYPDSDDNLFEAMAQETEMLFDSIVREDLDVMTLLTSDYTFINERLAKHYGIPDVMGNKFRRVTLTDENRFGVLGQGSVLTVTSYSNRTSPVARGKYVLEQILGVSAPTPPPNVPALEENNVLGGETLKLRSVRERLEQHRTNEPCNSCHKIMDPMGLALENFDAVGAWREKDSGFTVDPAGELANGTKVDGPTGLREALLDHSPAVLRNFTKQLLTYALGRSAQYYDMSAVRSIVRQAEQNDRRFSSIVMGIVESTPFQMRRVEEATDQNAGGGGLNR
jgi:hypothetical protein